MRYASRILHISTLVDSICFMTWTKDTKNTKTHKADKSLRDASLSAYCFPGSLIWGILYILGAQVNKKTPPTSFEIHLQPTSEARGSQRLSGTQGAMQSMKRVFGCNKNSEDCRLAIFIMLQGGESKHVIADCSSVANIVTTPQKYNM